MGTRYAMKEKDWMSSTGKKSLEWDLNDWKWDGDLFVAKPLNSVSFNSRQFLSGRGGEVVPVTTTTGGGGSNSSSSCSEEINLRSGGDDKSKKDFEKKRRGVVIIDEDDDDGGLVNDVAENLTLNLGEHVYPITQGGDVGGNGKKMKLAENSTAITCTASTTATTSRAVCQVEGCGADLSKAKPYHRRHKVCEVHSKTSQSLVGNVMQRFCQQCSRFHLLEEFDEGKRSCRRRLAGHNKRRRKPQRETTFNGSSMNDEETRSCLFVTLLKVLSNIHSDTSAQPMLSQVLRNLGSLANGFGVGNTSEIKQGSQDLLNDGTFTGASSKIVDTLFSLGSEPSGCLGSSSKIHGAQDEHARPANLSVTVAASGIAQVRTPTNNLRTVENDIPYEAEVQNSTAGRTKLNSFDLNCTYVDPQDCMEGLQRSETPLNLAGSSLDCPSWVNQLPHHSSPPQTSANSDSASDQSPSSSSGDAQTRTDRIVFKLFGKDPTDIPLVVRSQVLRWLSNSPTEIESYIRPGCIMLTIYLRLVDSMWEELYCDLSSSLSRLLDVSNDPFWRRGWVYVRVQHRTAFIFEGQVVLDMLLPLKEHNGCVISSIRPLALSVCGSAQLVVKGFNLVQSTTRLRCALEGKYLVQEDVNDFVEGTGTCSEDEELQSLRFTCSVPDVIGRGFIEVDDDGLHSSSFPFIVAEQDVCSEICTLESAMEESESDDEGRTSGRMGSKDQALSFVHEMGWLLHRCHLRSKLGDMDPNVDTFTFTRFRGLMEFAMDRDWCAVVKKLLDILFEGSVEAGDHASIELALSDMGLLHRAVRRNCRLMVERLLRYVPEKASEKIFPGQTQLAGRCTYGFLFRPDDVGPGGLTPLHIAASRIGSDSMLDVLTDDPGSVGVVAWKSVLDKTGLTPEGYARMRGHYSYIHLVQKKINNKSETGHIILNIPLPTASENSNGNQKQKSEVSNSSEVAGFQFEKAEPSSSPQSCRLCLQKVIYRKRNSFLGYRPTMLSMVSIAAVCVCLGLLFKSSPEVLDSLVPFRWEHLDFGTM
ncbi:hypothetical protein MKW94_030960 [Papaver nudicaule]|uniref:SBP-type domain-containing protein n=1 Tax=Papaver nudicaule TaxID=74823 RepID=A0AA41VVL4_PAPNU|nr:hypothetical protein [Papaver nudicaule]